MKITDKMRLDWLNEHEAYISHGYDGELCWIVVRRCSDEECDETHPLDGLWDSPRKAIDAAIKQETKSRALKGEKLKGGA